MNSNDFVSLTLLPIRLGLFQVRKAEFNNDVYVTHFGINILTNMTEVMGRVLNAPKIQYGGRVSTS